MDKLLVLQKRAMRLMTFNVQYPVLPGPLKPADPIFVKLGTLKIDDIYKYQVSKFIYKCIHQLTPVNFHNWFNFISSIHGYCTRSKFNANDNLSTNKLFIPFARTTNYGLKQLTVNGPRIWNALPDHLRNEESLLKFLRKLKIYFISMYNQSTVA